MSSNASFKSRNASLSVVLTSSFGATYPAFTRRLPRASSHAFAARTALMHASRARAMSPLRGVVRASATRASSISLAYMADMVSQSSALQIVLYNVSFLCMKNFARASIRANSSCPSSTAASAARKSHQDINARLTSSRRCTCATLTCGAASGTSSSNAARMASQSR